MALTYARENADSKEETYIRDSLIKERTYDVPIPQGLLQREIDTASAAWNYRFGSGFTLTGISAYQDVSYDRDTFGFAFPESEEAFTQEARLAYTGPGPLSGVAGFYYRDSDFVRDSVAMGSVNRIGSESVAGFGELTWHMTSALDLIGGVRVSQDRSTPFSSMAARSAPSASTRLAGASSNSARLSSSATPAMASLCPPTSQPSRPAMS